MSFELHSYLEYLSRLKQHSLVFHNLVSDLSNRRHTLKSAHVPLLAESQILYSLFIMQDLLMQLWDGALWQISYKSLL